MFGIIDFISKIATHFIGLFQQGGEVFAGWVSGIIPLLVVLMTGITAVIKLIGEERVNTAARWASKNIITRYTLLPILAVLFLTNPMCYTFGKFVEEMYKPAFYDSAVSFVHPVTGLFPHANAGELFVYMGIANGITQLGLPIAGLATRYFLVGILVIFIRGVLTERITLILMGRKSKKVAKAG